MFFKMILITIYTFLIISSSVESRKITKCLTGYMTDVQSWVDENGRLTSTIGTKYAIDLSSHTNPVSALQQKMEAFMDGMRSSVNRRVKYLSLARCMLNRVPPIFQSEDSGGRWLAQTVEYVSFFGNTFLDVSVPGQQYDVGFNATNATETSIDTPNKPTGTSVWSIGLQVVTLPNLRELDLRACSIQVLRSNLFRGMPQLEALYLGENKVYAIEAGAFAGLNNLLHLDFSRNEAFDDRGFPRSLETPTEPIFENLRNMTSLDLSLTKLTQRNIGVLRGLAPSLTRLSICDTGLNSLLTWGLSRTSLRYLDVSNNFGILNQQDGLTGIEDSLQVLYAKDIGLNSLEIFTNFSRLEILKLSHNEIDVVPTAVARTWKKMQILSLNKNRLTTWFEPTFSLMPSLRLLSLKNNNINIISEDIIEDFSNITYIALLGNFIVCNCHTRDFLELAALNEMTYKTYPLQSRNGLDYSRFQYHNGFEDYNRFIFKRHPVKLDCIDCYDEELKIRGKFVLLDYSPVDYVCLSVTTSESISISTVSSCHSSRDIDYDDVILGGHYKLYALLVLPCVFLPMLLSFLFCRRKMLYFFITLRNSATLSLIHKKEFIEDDTIFNYDVFVSYCNEDRGWVLDHLLPHLESDCSISACLHERDFQVGLSILENIVSCMDRSRSIMLIISQRFLMSQWCQFEMHLAQHRLLETRREDLTLVLLEEIPRRLRPTTLHYLMLTKTYIVWPIVDTERALFWKRLRKSLVTHKLKQIENSSLA